MTAADAGAVAPGPDKAAVRTIVFGVMLSVFLGTLAQGVVAPALPTLARELGRPLDASWVVSAYLIAGTASTPLFGKFADIWGRRRAISVAVGLFVFGSIGCALSDTMGTLILWRGIQGAGGGAIIALAMVIVADIVAPRERGRYQPYLTTTFVVGAVVGPALGGFLAQYAHWTAIFWVCAGLGLFCLVLGGIILARLPRRERPHKLDYPGAILLVLASTSLMAALSRHGDSGQSWLMLAGSALAWIALGWRLLTAAEPLIPVHILRSPLVLSGTLAATFATGVLIVLTTFLPSYFQTVMGLTVSQAGLALTPMLAGSAIGSVAAGQTMVRHARYRWVAEAGLIVSGLAIAALALLSEQPPLWLVETLLIVASFGCGAITPVTTFSIQNSVQMHELGIATSTNNFVRQLGSAIMVAGVGGLALHPRDLDHIRQADFQMLFWSMAGAFALAYGSLLLMEERALRGDD